MADTKGISVQVPVDLHAKVKAEQEQLELTMSEYIQQVLEQHFTPKLDMEGGDNMMSNTRTLAFQVDEELFQRVKAYLAEHKGANGRPLSQKDFVIGLIEQELNRWETQGAGGQPETASEPEVGSEEWKRRHWNPLTGTYGSNGAPESDGEGGQDTESGGEDGQTTEGGGEDGQDTESDGEDGQDTESDGEDGQDTESDGEDGQDTESDGEDGQNTESGGEGDTLSDWEE